jgi:hypothetical protein
MKKSILFVIFCLLAGLGGCKNPVVPQQSISFTFHNLKPNRPGEIYALWAEVPPGSIAPRPNAPLHGTFKSKLISTFTMNDTGGIIGLDLAGARNRVGVDFSLIANVELSVERADSVGTAPTAYYLFGTVAGQKSTGTATLRADIDQVFGTAQSGVSGVATLATSHFTPAKYTGEVYLMNATDASNTSPGLSLPPSLFLPATWRYGLWTVDSVSSPPIFSFLGYVIAVDSKDTKSAKDNYNYPGGKSPNDTAVTLLDLTNGKSGVLMTLEPDVISRDPVIPFPAPVLWGIIPKGETAFNPFPLQNISGNYPTVDVIINR